MEDKLATFDRTAQRIGISQIARDTLHIQFPELARRAAQCTYSMAPLGEEMRDVPAKKAASTGY